MKVDYTNSIAKLEKELRNLRNLQETGNLIIKKLKASGVEISDLRTFVSSITIELKKPWIDWEECVGFTQDHEAILIALKTTQEQILDFDSDKDSKIIIGYEFFEKIGVNMTHEQIKDIVEEKQGKRPSDLFVDLQVGTSHRIVKPHIHSIHIQIGGHKQNVGETEFGVKKYLNKVKKAEEKKVAIF